MKKSIATQHIFSFLLICVISGILYSLTTIKNWRFDLTSDNRFTLSETTIDIIENLDDVVYIQVYLEGNDLPAEFVQLKRETEIMLSDLRGINTNVQYEFINPILDKSESEVNDIIRTLSKKGIFPSTMLINEGDARKEKIFFPWALLTFNEKEVPINLYKSNPGANESENIQNSINALEYEWINALRKASTSAKPLIGFVKGHGELESIQLKDLQNALRESYKVKEIDFRQFDVDSITGELNIAAKYHHTQLFDALIVAKPQSKFTDLDKLFIDQFLIRGGKVMWMVDAVHAEMDSLSKKGEVIAYPKRELNIEDLLFKYGVRLNTNLVKDINCATIPMNASMQNGQSKWTKHPWFYFPLVLPEKSHSITNNLNTVKLEFASTIDLITSPGIKKTPLLKTSQYTGVQNTPSRIRLKDALAAPKEEQFQSGQKAVAYLLEGTFTSYFKNKILPKNKIGIPFVETYKPSKMIVISDGDIGKNYVNRKGQPVPLGFDRYSNVTYANRKFLVNCMDYLLEGEDLITLRNRDVKMRLLDRSKIKDEYQFWQIVNALIPALLLGLFAFITFVMRKRKYTK